jgi:hypothetical protein
MMSQKVDREEITDLLKRVFGRAEHKEVLIDNYALQEALIKVVDMAAKVVPTSEQCPLEPALIELSKILDEIDYNRFHSRY